MRILFAHGLESGPSGRKVGWFRDAGHDVRVPDARGLDLEARIVQLLAALRADAEPRVLVGSSFGGIAGLLAAIAAAPGGRGPVAMLLCAPALQLPAPPRFAGTLQPPCPAAVVHGTRDEIIPVDVGHGWAVEHGATWIPCDDDHSLANSRDVVLAALDALVSTEA